MKKIEIIESIKITVKIYFILAGLAHKRNKVQRRWDFAYREASVLKILVKHKFSFHEFIFRYLIFTEIFLLGRLGNPGV